MKRPSPFLLRMSLCSPIRPPPHFSSSFASFSSLFLQRKHRRKNTLTKCNLIIVAPYCGIRAVSSDFLRDFFSLQRGRSCYTLSLLFSQDFSWFDSPNFFVHIPKSEIRVRRTLLIFEVRIFRRSVLPFISGCENEDFFLHEETEFGRETTDLATLKGAYF